MFIFLIFCGGLLLYFWFWVPFYFFFFRKSLGMILLWCYSWKSMGGLYWVGVYFREIEVDFRVWSQECPQSTLLPIPSSGLFQSHCRLDPKFLPLLSFLVVFPQAFHHNLISFTVFILSSLSSQAKWQILLISLPPSLAVMNALTSAGGNMTEIWTVGFQHFKD